MFQRERLLDILKNFILFSGDAQRPVKILAGYHQYFAGCAEFLRQTPVQAESGRPGWW